MSTASGTGALNQGMPNYRRTRIPGATYFFTVNLANRSQRLLTDRIDLLRSAFAATKRLTPFTIDAIVILPDHLHCMWTLPAGDSDFSSRWRRIKTSFSCGISPPAHLSPSLVRKGERGIWQRRFWEHAIRDDEDYLRHLHYIHHNPVKHRHVQRVVDWPYSSFHRCVREGLYPIDWVGDAESDASFGGSD